MVPDGACGVEGSWQERGESWRMEVKTLQFKHLSFYPILFCSVPKKSWFLSALIIYFCVGFAVVGWLTYRLRRCKVFWIWNTPFWVPKTVFQVWIGLLSKYLEKYLKLKMAVLECEILVSRFRAQNSCFATGAFPPPPCFEGENSVKIQLNFFLNMSSYKWFVIGKGNRLKVCSGNRASW